MESFDRWEDEETTRSTLATQDVGALHCCILGVLTTSLTALDTFTRVFGHECVATSRTWPPDQRSRVSLPHVQGGMLSLLELVLEPSPLCCRSLQDLTTGSDRCFTGRLACTPKQGSSSSQVDLFSCYDRTETRLIFDAREANHGLFVGRLVCTERSWELSFDIYVSVVKTRQRGPSPPLQLGPAQSLLAAHILRLIFFDNFCGRGSRTEGCRGGAQGYDGEVYRRYGSMLWMMMVIFFLCLSSLQMDPNGARIAAKTAASRARSPQHGKQSLSSVWTGLAGCWNMQCHSSDFGLDSWRFNASGEGNGTGETLVVGTRLNKNDHWAPQLRIGTQQTRRPRRNGGGWCRALRTLVVDSRRPCAVSTHCPQDLLSPFAVVDHEAAINDASTLQHGWKRSTMGPSKTSEDQTG